LATTRLQALTAGRSIVCQEKDRDRYGRIVAICRASGEDLSAILVREGMAWAFTRYSVDYVDQQEEARIANRGVHAHDCVPAWERAEVASSAGRRINERAEAAPLG
jgi:endonuclease YncB( thermonuclease family)